MDYKILTVFSALVMVFENIEATQPPGTAIPTLFPPKTTTRSTTPAPTFPTSRASTTTTTVTSSTLTSTLAPITSNCYAGSCDTSQCSNSSFTMATMKCGSSIHTCVTEITALKVGGKQYDFRCGRTNCTVEMKSANKSTEVMCCNQANCNTIQGALGTGNSGASNWTGVTTLVVGIVALLQLCKL